MCDQLYGDSTPMTHKINGMGDFEHVKQLWLYLILPEIAEHKIRNTEYINLTILFWTDCLF